MPVVAGILRQQSAAVEGAVQTAADADHGEEANHELGVGAPTLSAADTSVRGPEMPQAKQAPPA